MAMGSLIKNPGGTIAPGGGYVVGPSSLLDKVSARLSAPGVGRDAGGISADEQRLLMQGSYCVPTCSSIQIQRLILPLNIIIYFWLTSIKLYHGRSLSGATDGG